ncbi:hypothetical protein BD560DRAFT_424122 [Blakeslea trispora]|nr:hypothetical protein BD560DRAFT_424122 [Blakeslea trispora]
MKDTKRTSKKQNNVRFTGRFSATRGFMPNQPTLLTAFNSARISNNNTCNVPEVIAMSDSVSDQENDEDDLQQDDRFDHELSREDYPSEHARGTFWIEPMMLKKNKKAESFLSASYIFVDSSSVD